jgi:hypothetical protein
MTTMTSPRHHDPYTVMAVGMLVYLVKNVVHEGLGHGGVCLLVGGEPIAISSAWWHADYQSVGIWGQRWAKAGGTLANLLLAFALLPFWPRLRTAKPTIAYFFWLTIVANLLSGGGYMMVDPFFGFGDWGGFLKGLESAPTLRFGIAAGGIAISLLGVFWGRRNITMFLPQDPVRRKKSIRMLCWAPYFVGGAVFVLSAAFNPQGPRYLITVALATFGGTAWLAWFLPFMVRPSDDEQQVVVASTGWRVVGIMAALFTVAVLGPSIRFG